MKKLCVLFTVVFLLCSLGCATEELSSCPCEGDWLLAECKSSYDGCETALSFELEDDGTYTLYLYINFSDVFYQRQNELQNIKNVDSYRKKYEESFYQATDFRLGELNPFAYGRYAFDENTGSVSFGKAKKMNVKFINLFESYGLNDIITSLPEVEIIYNADKDILYCGKNAIERY